MLDIQGTNRVLEHLAAPLLAADSADCPMTIHQLATIKLSVQPTSTERTFNYFLRLAYVNGQGCCYMFANSPMDTSLVGKRISVLQQADLATRIAVIDGAYASEAVTPSDQVELRDGDISKRGRERAEFIASRIVSRYSLKSNDTVIMIGIVGEIIRALRARDIQVLGYDLEQSIVGKTYGGVTVQDGRALEAGFPFGQVVLATAMTLSTGTYTHIASVAQMKGTPLVVFAETGAHFAPKLLKHGADAVFSEPFPFYVFGGQSVVRFFQRD